MVVKPCHSLFHVIFQTFSVPYLRSGWLTPLTALSTGKGIGSNHHHYRSTWFQRKDALQIDQGLPTATLLFCLQSFHGHLILSTHSFAPSSKLLQAPMTSSPIRSLLRAGEVIARLGVLVIDVVNRC